MLKYQVSLNFAIASYLDSLYFSKYLEEGAVPYHASYNGVSPSKIFLHQKTTQQNYLKTFQARLIRWMVIHAILSQFRLEVVAMNGVPWKLGIVCSHHVLLFSIPIVNEQYYMYLILLFWQSFSIGTAPLPIL